MTGKTILHTHWFKILVLFLLLETLAVAAVLWYSGHERDRFLSEEYADVLAGYRSVLATSDTLSRAIFSEVLNRDAVVSLVARAVDATPVERNRLRLELQHQVTGTYQNIMQYNLNQLHFHLPGLTSFLRMHRPEYFGDSLAQARPSIVLAHKRREFVAGFEVGRHEAGFRFIFPLFDQRRFVGTVETSISYDRFREQLKARFSGDYLLLLKRSLVEQRIVDKYRHGLVTSPFCRTMLQERFGEGAAATVVSSEVMATIARQVAPRIEPLVAQNRPVHLEARVAGQGYGVFLLPLNNVAQQQEAYLLLVERLATLDTYRLSRNLALVVATLLALMVCAYQYLIAQRNRTLRESSRLYQATIDALPYPFHVIDIATRKIVLANKAAYHGGTSVVGQSCYSVSHGVSQPCDDPAHPCPLGEVLVKREPVVVQHIHRAEDGSDLHVEVHAYPLLDDDGEIRRCIEYSVDVTERQRLQQHLTWMAESDPLTGIPNRRKFHSQLQLEIRRAERHKRVLSLLTLDIDFFKQINDSHGHDIGDAVLVEFVRLLQGRLRVTDLLARTGGEEFQVMLPETTLPNARMLAEKVVQAIREHRFDTVGQVTVSIGLATWQQGEAAGELIKRSDHMLYRAKSAGRDRWEG